MTHHADKIQPSWGLLELLGGHVIIENDKHTFDGALELPITHND